MIEPTISVILPVYNGEKYLREAINSILEQTFSDFELIILNDGSTDATEEIIHTFRDQRIRYERNQTNLKLIQTLNKGIGLARGKYIARMDADDVSLPNRFELQLSEFKKNPHIDIVNANPYLLDEGGKSFRRQISALTLSPDAITLLIPFQNFVCHPSVMVKSSTLKKYRFIDEISKEHIEDFDLWNRMLRDSCACITMKDSVLLYRNNPKSINRTQRAHQMDRMAKLCDLVLKERFDFTVQSNMLKVILDDQASTESDMVLSVDRKLKEFNLMVRSTHSLNEQIFGEIEAWRKQRIVVLTVRSLINLPMAKRGRLLFFLLSRLNYTTLIRFISRTRSYSRID